MWTQSWRVPWEMCVGQSSCYKMPSGQGLIMILAPILDTWS